MLEYLTNDNGKWPSLKGNWKSRCEALGENFEEFEQAAFSIVNDLAKEPKLTGHRTAGIFGLPSTENGWDAFCQLNCANLPGYSGKVLRTRMMVLSPDFDSGERSVEEYVKLISSLFAGVIEISNDTMKSEHVKFHLRSPADKRFFAMLGSKLDGTGIFNKVETKGAWLYITK